MNGGVGFLPLDVIESETLRKVVEDDAVFGPPLLPLVGLDGVVIEFIGEEMHLTLENVFRHQYSELHHGIGLLAREQIGHRATAETYHGGALAEEVSRLRHA